MSKQKSGGGSGDGKRWAQKGYKYPAPAEDACAVFTSQKCTNQDSCFSKGCARTKK